MFCINVELREITKDNYIDCVCVHVREDQESYVYSNSFSLTQAHFEKEQYPYGIYCDEIMVGFLMFGWDTDLEHWSLVRFMVDARYQGRGIGQQALRIFLSRFRAKYGLVPLCLRVNRDNDAAIHLYKKLGFEQTGVIDDEEILRL